MKVGEPRFGWLIDGDPETPYVSALLLDDGERITVRVPWRIERPSGPYHQWFHSGGLVFGDGPAEPRPLPEILWFMDVDGMVALVGCHAAGHRNNEVPRGVGEGTIDVQWAVLDGGVAGYQTLNGMRTEIPGLSGWLGLRSVKERLDIGEGGRLQGLDLSLRSPEPVPLDRAMNLRLRPTFRSEKAAHGVRMTIFDAIQVETHVKRARPWQDHLTAHGAVRDLIEIAAWQAFPESLTLVNRADDPHRDLSGGDHGEKWNEVRTYGYRSGFEEPQRPRFLFTFADIGPTGFRRWVRLRGHYKRGIWPWMAVVGGTRMHLETQVAESGIGFEAIGYQLAIDDGVGRQRAKRESHEMRLKRIVSTLPDGLLPDLDEWVRLSTETYNGVKHANRDMPDIHTLVNVLRRNVMVFRVWVATTIGVPTTVLEHAVATDPMRGDVQVV